MKELQASLNRWLAAGLITPEQATAILAAERPPVGVRRVSLVAEALGYLGGSLAIIAGVIIISDFWADLETWARMALIGLATAALFGAGFSVRRSPEPAVERLSGFLWFLSSGGVAFLAGLTGDDLLDLPEETVFLLAGMATSVYSFLLWRARLGALQQLALKAGLITLATAGLGHIDGILVEYQGLAVWSLGAAWGFLVWGGMVLPQRTGYALASLAMLGGAQLFAFEQGPSLVLGLVTAGVLLAASVVLGSTVLLGFGAAGIFLFVPEAIFDFFGDTLGGPVALFLVGIILLGSAILIARLKQQVGAGA